ncbi:MAG: TraB/GumN family protein [Chitinophagales bacterium]|nr:TraB/GumN family protein [Chitinophagales bacterium]
MNKILFCTFILLSTICGDKVYAQSKQADNRSLLWKISGKDMRQPSYLFGTIHMICKEQFIWTKAMEKSLEASEEVCMEMDMDDPSILMQIASGMIEGDGKKLQDHFTEEEYKLVEKYFADSLDIDITMFAGMKPIVLQTLLVPSVQLCDSTVSYEIAISGMAKSQQKEITGLESPAEQIKLMDEIPVDSIIKELLEVASGKTGDDSDNIEMINAYVHQDIPALYELILKSKEQGDNLDAFLDERNEKWIDRMAEHMDQRSVFFAVGAGHLWGEKGLINLLRLQGYTVEPLK